MRKSMYYTIYLIVIGIALVMGAVTKVGLYPALSVHVNFSDIINFLDVVGIAFILVVCLIALLGTRSFLPLKDALVFMFNKRNYTAAQYENCLLAVKTTMISALAAGFIMFLMSMVNMFKGIDLSGGSSMLGTQLSMGLVTPIYSLIIVFIFLPIYVELQRHLSPKAEGDRGKQHIAVRSKNKKAG